MQEPKNHSGDSSSAKWGLPGAGDQRGRPGTSRRATSSPPTTILSPALPHMLLCCFQQAAPRPGSGPCCEVGTGAKGQGLCALHSSCLGWGCLLSDFDGFPLHPLSFRLFLSLLPFPLPVVSPPSPWARQGGWEGRDPLQRHPRHPLSPAWRGRGLRALTRSPDRPSLSLHSPRQAAGSRPR